MSANQDQSQFWNDVAGANWVELQPVLDRMFAGLVPPLLDGLGLGDGSVLDVGCGAGALTLAALEHAGAQARGLGVDISAPLIAAAEARARAISARQASFLVADAQTHAFPPASFDAVLSRFGVMFFDDPVAAFTNLRGAARPDASLRFTAWRSPTENPFMTAIRRAALPFVDLPAGEPNAPGQFGFADRGHVLRILSAAGWRDVEIEPIDVPCTLPSDALPVYATRMGPLGPLWPAMAPDLRARLEAPLREAFAMFLDGDEARFTAACWLVTGRA